jgi:hypothetical protein
LNTGYPRKLNEAISTNFENPSESGIEGQK